jgi:hydrogenase-4 component B
VLAESMFTSMNFISLGAVSLLILFGAVLIIRSITLKRYKVKTGPTWGCGYTAVDSRQQYTATSFVQEYAELARPVIKTGHSNITFSDDEIFAEKRDFHTHSDDFVKSKLIFKPVEFIINMFRRAAVFQTGRLQHYVLYLLLFLLMIFLLTFLKVI